MSHTQRSEVINANIWLLSVEEVFHQSRWSIFLSFLVVCVFGCVHAYAYDDTVRRQSLVDQVTTLTEVKADRDFVALEVKEVIAQKWHAQ